YLSIYANADALLKQVDDVVRPGEPLATAGASGGNEETGLYFELRHLGRAFDPLGWVTLKKATPSTMQKLRSIGFILVGAVAGVLISLNFQAIADRATRTPLPIEELRAFTEVVDAIKKNYVEPVEDKKLFTEAINGMLTGLDPHSAYLDQ